MGTPLKNYVAKDRESVLLAHWYVLSNTEEVAPYIQAHKEILRNNHGDANTHDMMNERVTIKVVLITSRMPNIQLENVLILAQYAC